MKTKLTYKFRLSQKDVQSGLKLHIDELADARKLTEEIKTALTLLAQLRNGNTALLNELFPTICTPKPTPPDADDINRRLDRIEAKLDKKPTANIQDNSLPDGRSQGFPLMSPTPKPSGKLASINLAMPVLDDDDDMPQMTVKLTPLTGATNGSNLLAGMFGLEADDDQDTLVIKKSTSSGNSEAALAAMRSIAF